MAKGLYIGNTSSIAKKTKSIYLGNTSNIAKKIKKMYLGDASGKAKESYSGSAGFQILTAISNYSYRGILSSNDPNIASFSITTPTMSYNIAQLAYIPNQKLFVAFIAGQTTQIYVLPQGQTTWTAITFTTPGTSYKYYNAAVRDLFVDADGSIYNWINIFYSSQYKYNLIKWTITSSSASYEMASSSGYVTDTPYSFKLQKLNGYIYTGCNGKTCHKGPSAEVFTFVSISGSTTGFGVSNEISSRPAVYYYGGYYYYLNITSYGSNIYYILYRVDNISKVGSEGYSSRIYSLESYYDQEYGYASLIYPFMQIGNKIYYNYTATSGTAMPPTSIFKNGTGIYTSVLSSSPAYTRVGAAVSGLGPVYYVGGKYYAAITASNANNNKIAYSTNCITWTAITSTKPSTSGYAIGPIIAIAPE